MNTFAEKALALAMLALALAIAFYIVLGALRPDPVAACEPEPITANTPTGIAGCERWGDGVASHYGPGHGVAMNFCTWEVRHSVGCGSVVVQSHDTGLTVTVPVVDFCDCYTGTADERIVDLQYGVVAALGLDQSRGLYPVTVWRSEAVVESASIEGGSPGETVAPPVEPTPPPVLPDTAVAP